MAWTLQPQEQDDQKYFFNGKAYITNGARTLLTEQEVQFIISELQKLAIEKEGIDYLQVFTNEKEERVWVIDQLDQNMKESGEYSPDFNYFTILLPQEY